MSTNIKTDSNDGTPRGALVIRTVAFPAQMNSGGNIFGGWVLGQMDTAGGITAAEHAQGRVATVAVKAMKFEKPVHVGDVICCYVDVVKVGSTSITTHVQVWVHRHKGAEISEIKVTEGDFVFVALNEKGKPRAIPR